MTQPILRLPYWTADLPGVAGALRHSEDDFRVDEVLPYPPSGAGDHVFVRVEKRGLTTPAAARLLAGALGVKTADIGWAGMKDKRAVTRQTFSLPPPCTPEAAAALDLPGVVVLDATRHRHKLRTGHVRANRFTLALRDIEVTADEAAARATAILERLAAVPGAPNWYGAQRFGTRGDNGDIGRALVTGDALPRGARRPRGRDRRLYISAYQSQLFNEYLRRRMVDGLYDQVLTGDLLQKLPSGGIFGSTDPAADSSRMRAGEIVPTGPMYGHKVMLPPEGSAARQREDALLHDEGLDLRAFAHLGKLATGTRRALAVRVGDPAVRPIGERAIEVSFELPAGSYATAVMREVVKGSTSFPG